jgi:hypothetical protein
MTVNKQREMQFIQLLLTIYVLAYLYYYCLYLYCIFILYFVNEAIETKNSLTLLT